jgi:hypothetical protein
MNANNTTFSELRLGGGSDVRGDDIAGVPIELVPVAVVAGCSSGVGVHPHTRTRQLQQTARSVGGCFVARSADTGRQRRHRRFRPFAHDPDRSMPIGVIDVDAGRLTRPQPEQAEEAEQGVIHRPRCCGQADTCGLTVMRPSM